MVHAAAPAFLFHISSATISTTKDDKLCDADVQMFHLLAAGWTVIMGSEKNWICTTGKIEFFIGHNNFCRVEEKPTDIT
jgi:hypothetical protein